jgi:hypothetical protein
MKSSIRKTLETEMIKILESRTATVYAKLDAGRLLAALSLVWIPEGITESSLPSKVTAQAMLAKSEVYAKVKMKKDQNKRNYLSRQIRALKLKQEQEQAAQQAEQPQVKEAA